MNTQAQAGTDASAGQPMHLGPRVLAAQVMALVVVLVLAGCQTPATPASVQPAPDFTLTTLDGDRIQLAALRGRWVLVNFWATWCAPCREEMPYLHQLAVEHSDQLTVLAVNMRESEQEIAAFVDELDLELPVLLAPDDATLLAYNVRGLPLSVLIDPSGAVVRRIAGPIAPGLVEAEIENRR
jgi:thiol-disulfide isomerase/thioredoxin